MCRGHTVVVDDVAHGPGAQVTLDRAEAARLGGLGFVADAPPVLDTAEPRPAGKKEQAAQDARTAGDGTDWGDDLGGLN